MILIDTSAWVEYLRNRSGRVADSVESCLSGGFATCDPIQMELLAGARDERHLMSLRRMLASGTLLPTESIDYDQAAALYRHCRARGATIRKLTDCLIAAVAIRHQIGLLHNDGDFDQLSRHTGLEVER